MSLPHRYPFRLVDRAGERRAVALWSADSYWCRGDLALPVTLLIEAGAQAAACLLPVAGAPRDRLLLAAVERAGLARPLQPGELLEIEARVVARLGKMVRVETRVLVADRVVGEASLTLVGGA